MDRRARDDRGNTNLLPAVVLVIGAVLGGYLFMSGRSAASGPGATTTVVEAEAAPGGATDPEGVPADDHGAAGPGADHGEDDSHGEDVTHGDTEQADPGLAAVAWSESIGVCIAESEPPSAEVTRLVTDKPVFLYSAAEAEVWAEPGRVVADVAPGNMLVLGGRDFELTQVVLAPTVHRVDGQPGAFEVQLVHHGVSDGTLAVVAMVGVQGTTPAPLLDELVKGRPAPGGEKVRRTLDLYGFVPGGALVGHDLFGPAGDCGLVHRGVFAAPLEATYDQVAAVRAVLALGGPTGR